LKKIGDLTRARNNFIGLELPINTSRNPFGNLATPPAAPTISQWFLSLFFRKPSIELKSQLGARKPKNQKNR